MMRSPASAIRSEIRQLINLHIEVFRSAAPLTDAELEECRRRAEQIRQLGKELDRLNLCAISPERLRRAS